MGNIISTTWRVNLIRKKAFRAIILNREHETFVVHIVTLSVKSGNELQSSKETKKAYYNANNILM